MLEAKIAAVDETLRRAETIGNRTSPGVIGLGSSVTLKVDGRHEEAYTLVGPAEADPLAGRISHESPLGAALLGHCKGERIEWEGPDGPHGARITDVSRQASQRKAS